MKLTRRQLLGLASIIPMATMAACSKEQPEGTSGGSEGSAQGGSDENSSANNSKVDEAIDAMTLEQQVAQLFVCAPEDLTGVAVQTRAGDATREALQALPVGGFCWFGYNLEDPDQTREMLSNVQIYSKAICGLPFFNAVDEEGGDVARVANNSAFGVENVGNMRNIGIDGTADDAEKAASTIASYLTDLGFNVDFAPVADVVSSAANVDLVWRSFGTDADIVSDMVAAQVKGFKDGNILCSPKHFPGIGYATGDSEKEPISTDRTLEEMLDCELKPFKAGIKAGAPMIMVGHVNCPALSDSGLPASLDSEVIQGILREEMGFKGIVITDALQMGAITALSDDPSQIPLMAFEAGVDILLMPSNLQESYDVMLDAVKSGRVSEERLRESLRRIVGAKLEL